MAEEQIDKSKMRIGDILVHRKFVTPQQMQEAFRLQKETGLRLGEQLLEMRVCTEDHMLEALAWQKDVPTINLAGVEVAPSAYDCLAADYIDQNCVLPLDLSKDVLTIVHHDPLNMSFVIDEVQHKSGYKVKAYAATEKAIRHALGVFRERMKEFLPLLDALQAEMADKPGHTTDTIHDLSEATTPIIAFVNLVFRTAMKWRATDVYLECVREHLKIRYRIDGEVQEILKFPAPFDRHKEKVIARVKMMANLDISEKRLPQDGKFKAQLETNYVDCRVNVCPTVDGEKAVVRLLSKDRLNISLSNIGLSNYTFKLLTYLLQKPHGLILVTGPTGSGKTSTLYAALNYLWRPTKSIVTVEDPVEYEVDDYSQSQVNPDIGLTFAEILRALLRQAPDIILVGEIRDAETAKIACEAAMTGHLVLSTLHANDSPSSVLRLTEIGVDHFLVASVFVGVIAQRLVRKLCARCREKSALSKELEEFAQKYKLKSEFIFKKRGCNACLGSGYAGRTGIHEILQNTPDVSEVITRRGTPFDILTEARKKGFVSLREDALLKVFQGITDLEQVFKVAGV